MLADQSLDKLFALARTAGTDKVARWLAVSETVHCRNGRDLQQQKNTREVRVKAGRYDPWASCKINTLETSVLYATLDDCGLIILLGYDLNAPAQFTHVVLLGQWGTVVDVHFDKVDAIGVLGTGFLEHRSERLARSTPSANSKRTQLNAR